MKFDLLKNKNEVKDLIYKDIVSPVDFKIIGSLPIYDSIDQINTAFYMAKKYSSSWSNLPWEKRAMYLKNFAHILETKKQELANIMCAEIAKAYNECINEIERTIQYIADTIECYKRYFTNSKNFTSKDLKIANKEAQFKRVPIGTVLAIAPFNYPVNLLLAKLAPALISGNTVVFKGSSEAILTTTYIKYLFQLSDFPIGVVNYVCLLDNKGYKLLTSHKNINMISFTGSTSVGKKIMNNNLLIPVVLELGGKDPALVLDDADLEQASKEIIKGAFAYNGQRCTAIKRVFVSNNNHDKLVELLKNELLNLSIGSPFENNFITPLISQKAVEKCLRLVYDATSKGANIIGEIKNDKNLLWPLIIDNVNQDMDIAWDEPFGPLLPIITYENIYDAIDLINKSEYGLQASIFTNNKNAFNKFAKLIDAGSINWNRSPSRGPDILPFLGKKNSGLGVQGIYDSIISMTTYKGFVYNY